MSISSTDVQTYSTANPYELSFGYSRAVRKGPFIFVAGTTAVSLEPSDVPVILYAGSAYLQALHIFHIITEAVEAVGGTKSDIVRVRMFVTHDSDAGDVGKALKERFLEVEHKPVATMIVGARFVAADMRVEIEADAVHF